MKRAVDNGEQETFNTSTSTIFLHLTLTQVNHCLNIHILAELYFSRDASNEYFR